MGISDWRSDVCSADLPREADHTIGAIAHRARRSRIAAEEIANPRIEQSRRARPDIADDLEAPARCGLEVGIGIDVEDTDAFDPVIVDPPVDRAGVEALVQVGDQDRLRSEEHTSELQSLMRISYAVFCLKKKN